MVELALYKITFFVGKNPKKVEHYQIPRTDEAMKKLRDYVVKRLQNDKMITGSSMELLKVKSMEMKE